MRKAYIQVINFVIINENPVRIKNTNLVMTFGLKQEHKSYSFNSTKALCKMMLLTTLGTFSKCNTYERLDSICSQYTQCRDCRLMVNADTCSFMMIS